MDRTQLTGALLIAGAVIQLVVLLVGVAKKSYFAIAVPVSLALAGISVLAIWVGWTMMTTESDVPEPDEETPPVTA